MADTNRAEVEEAGSPWSPSDTNKSRDATPKSSGILRKAQEAFTTSRPPVGIHHAMGSFGSGIPTIADVQRGNYNTDGWSGPGQRRNSQAHRPSDWQVMHVHNERKKSLATDIKKEPIVEVEKTSTPTSEKDEVEGMTTQLGEASTTVGVRTPHDPSVPYANGYQFPPKHTALYATNVFLVGAWKFVTTPFGFIVTVYSLNVVAWGGMLFLILCHATPAMAHPSYNDDYSGAKIWLEIDSQILNALFCVTGLGLIPWRFRDLYYLLQWRWKKNTDGLRRLAGIHKGWFRLQGSQELSATYNAGNDGVVPGVDESALAIPLTLTPEPPLTGERAPASVYWKLDFVIWAFVINTFLQIMLCGFMWGMNRFNRPGWIVGLLISVACIVAMAGGWMIFKEGKAVKKIEGVPVSKEDQELLEKMREREGQIV